MTMTVASNPTATAVFEIKDLTKVYGSDDAAVWALRGVNMTLYEGELAVLLGPSGSGKSTLLNIIGGLDQASSGTVHFRDLELTRMNERRLTLFRRRSVGFVFQFYNLIPSLTARENVALVTEISPCCGGRSSSFCTTCLSTAWRCSVSTTRSSGNCCRRCPAR